MYLEVRLLNVFNVSSDKTPAEVVDMVRHQWKMYQLMEIPESMYLVKVRDDSGKVCSTSSRNNYWDYALEYCGILSQSVQPEVKCIRLDDYWSSIGEMIDENGMLKYQQRFCLSKAVLSISHGNVPERVFSSKYLLSVHGNYLSESTLVTFVKDD